MYVVRRVTSLFIVFYRRHGTGTFASNKDGKKYTGPWVDGKKHGEGILYFPAGDTLKGNWHHGELQDTLGFKFHSKSVWINPSY